MAKILLAPDSFKGSATSQEVAVALSKGWSQERPKDQITQIAFADGGEGTLESIESAVQGSVRVPLRAQSGDGRERDCYWLLLDGDTAVIEMALVCGITTVEKLDALNAHSYGLGQAIAAAASDTRVKEILIAVGGSASTDAGVGALMALGFECVDAAGENVHFGGGALCELKKISGEFVAPVRGIKILVDVQSPMTGLTGAAHVFGPQKGASVADVELLNEGLKNFLTVIGGVDAPGYGAAGGVSGGLALVVGAQIVSGVKALAAITGVAEKLSHADLIITGEGAFDSQSYHGKVVGYLLDQAKSHGVDAMVVCGVNKNGDDERVISLVEIAPSTPESISNAEYWLEVAGGMLARKYKTGM